MNYMYICNLPLNSVHPSYIARFSFPISKGGPLFFLIICFTSYFVFSVAVLPHSPGVLYYHLLLRRETRIPGVAPFSFRIGIWDLFVHRGQKILYTHSLWEVVDHSRSKMHETCLIIIHDPSMRLGPESNWRPLD